MFLRSQGGADPVTCLWTLDVGTGKERLVADPRALGADEENLPAEERIRRERVREQAGGIVAYATDSAVTVAAFALSGRVYAVGLTGDDAQPYQVTTRTPALDPRPDPAGDRLAYVCEGALHVTGLDGNAWDRTLADPQGVPDLSYGLPEFIAAEEMYRNRGYWWAPDGSALLVARVDDSPVRRWYISDPANPASAPAQVGYPAAGTPNAAVRLMIVHLTGRRVDVDIDHETFPYIVTAHWQEGHRPLVVVQTRDQRTMRLLDVDVATGATSVIREDTDPHWVEIVLGAPAWTASGKIVWSQDSATTRQLLVAAPEELADRTALPVTPEGLQVRYIEGVDGDTVVFRATPADDPSRLELWAYDASPEGAAGTDGARGTDGVNGADGVRRLSREPGVHMGSRSGGTLVIAARTLDSDGYTVRVYRDDAGGFRDDAEGSGGDGSARGEDAVATIASVAEEPSLPAPAPEIFAAGPRGITTAVLFPSWHARGSGKLPVLLDPYGGPHGQRVLAARSAYLEPQWFAEQGFAVVVADGRGTPARGPGWERAVARDLATPVLEDQADALAAAAERFPDLDTGRVAIRGWSFGGYLAALAVLTRPDVFHAAISGAPVTDYRLYDTHYTERYLGMPETDPDAYDRSSLVFLAQNLVAPVPRPLLLIHGFADDNVVVAHTLRLSGALLAAGYPHEVLPLTGITHMATEETVAENLLKLQLAFLRRALGLG